MFTNKPTPGMELTYFTVSEAANFLGVSISTIRNWDKAGKLKAHRHPMNQYRLYTEHELEAVLRQLREIDEYHNEA